MQSIIRVAAVQMHSTLDREANASAAERLIEQAADQQASLIVLPELFPCLGTYQETAAAAQSIPGKLSDRFSQLAKRLNVTLLAGSMCEQDPTSDQCYNTSLLIGPDGTLIAKYRKQHLFDVDLPDGKSLRESDHFSAGDSIAVADTAGARCSLAICYDLRFPELFRQHADHGAEIILLPAAFTASTGKDHWHALIRARAIENQAFVVAANQSGRHSDDLETYGHSLIVDPWGELLAEADGSGEQVIVAELLAERLESIRRRFPALRHRRK